MSDPLIIVSEPDDLMGRRKIKVYCDKERGAFITLTEVYEKREWSIYIELSPSQRAMLSEYLSPTAIELKEGQ